MVEIDVAWVWVMISWFVVELMDLICFGLGSGAYGFQRFVQGWPMALGCRFVIGHGGSGGSLTNLGVG